MNTRKIKTSELIGSALDWAVAKVEGDELAARIIQYPKQSKFYSVKVTPSTNWSQGGPIIEREKLCVCPTGSTYLGAPLWSGTDDTGRYTELGFTPLIAAMRCYVASKLGDTVDIPEEILS